MSNIPYPNVPPLPGVPALTRAAPYVGAALTLLGEFLPFNLFGAPYSIINSDTNQVSLIPDSVVDFEYKEEAKIPIYPMQGGAFQSYNKVQMPFDLRMTVTCSGNGSMRKGAFLNTLTVMLRSTTFYTVKTPNAIYADVNLIHVDYKRESHKGATLLIVQLWFQFVRDVSRMKNLTASASGASPSSLGSLTPQSSPSSKLLSLVSSIG